jgi:hypothetical protein
MARDRHLAANPDDLGENISDFEETSDSEEIIDSEQSSRIAQWLETNAIENSQPYAVLYKFSEPIPRPGEPKSQVDYFKGIILLPHEIGLEYGKGRYMLMLSNTTTKNERRKCTTFRFTLHDSYDEKSRLYKAEKARRELLDNPVSLPAVPVSNQRETLSEAFTLFSSMQAQVINMFKPLLERALLPPPAPASAPASNALQDTFLAAGMFKQLLKTNMEDTVSIMDSLTRKALSLGQKEMSQGEYEESDLPPEKKSIFEKLIELAEPLIPLLIKNNLAAKATAAGIKAIPQFREITQDVSLCRKVIQYVDAKEGKENADIALRNLGIDRRKYSAPVPAAPAHAAATTAPAPSSARGKILRMKAKQQPAARQAVN